MLLCFTRLCCLTRLGLRMMLHLCQLLSPVLLTLLLLVSQFMELISGGEELFFSKVVFKCFTFKFTLTSVHPPATAIVTSVTSVTFVTSVRPSPSLVRFSVSFASSPAPTNSSVIFFIQSSSRHSPKRQADVNSLMLILALLCLLLPILFTYSAASPELTVESSLYLSRAASIVMLAAYFVYLIFQLLTHRQLFEAEDEGGDENIEAEEVVIGFWSGFAWLAGMTVFTALLSEYVVDTIEACHKLLLTGCIRFMGFISELPQHNLASNSWQCN